MVVVPSRLPSLGEPGPPRPTGLAPEPGRSGPGGTEIPTDGRAGSPTDARSEGPTDSRSAERSRLQVPTASRTGPGSGAPNDGAPEGRRPRVAVIGDSLIEQSAAEQTTALRDAGWDPTVFGDAGKALTASSIQAAIVVAASDRDLRVVVLATTSNDNARAAERAEIVGDDEALGGYGATLRRALVLLGDRCVVLVDARDAANEFYRGSFAARTNGELRRIADERPGTVVVAWSERSRPHPEWFVADQLHFVDVTSRHLGGLDAYAQAVRDGVSRCPR